MTKRRFARPNYARRSFLLHTFLLILTAALAPLQQWINQLSERYERWRRERAIRKYLQSAKGRSILSASMIQPLRAKRDYTSMLRKVYLVEEIPNHELKT